MITRRQLKHDSVESKSSLTGYGNGEIHTTNRQNKLIMRDKR